MAIVLGDPVRDRDDRALPARRRSRRTARGVRPRSARSSCMTTIAGSFDLAWALYASDYSRYLPRRHAAPRGLLVDVPRAVRRRGLDRDPRPAVVGALGDRGRHRPTRSTAILGGGHRRRDRDDRHRVRDRRRQRDERLHGLAVAPGGRAPRPAAGSAAIVAVLGFLVDALPQLQQLRRRRSRTTCCHHATGSRRGPRSSSSTGGLAATGSTAAGCRLLGASVRRRRPRRPGRRLRRLDPVHEPDPVRSGPQLRPRSRRRRSSPTSSASSSPAPSIGSRARECGLPCPLEG